MDALALPGAVGQFERDRLIFANNSFLRATGLKRREISSSALSAVATFHLDPVSGLKRAKLAPITVRSFDRNLSIGGFAAFNREGFVYLMIPAAPETNEAFQTGKAVGLETERLRISAYLHERLAPGLLAVMKRFVNNCKKRSIPRSRSSRKSAMTLTNCSALCTRNS